MNNEIRNIILNISRLKKILDNIETTKEVNNDINYYIDEIIERFTILLNEEQENLKYKIDEILKNKILLSHIKKGK